MKEKVKQKAKSIFWTILLILVVAPYVLVTLYLIFGTIFGIGLSFVDGIKNPGTNKTYTQEEADEYAEEYAEDRFEDYALAYGYYSEEEYDEAYDEAYDEGYQDGYQAGIEDAKGEQQ